MRALSRIAASMADLGRYQECHHVVGEAIEQARQQPESAFRHWAHYEIAGSTAYCADFETALRLYAQIPESLVFSGAVLRGAPLRDISRGYCCHGQVAKAVKLALQLPLPLARIQALSRIVRLSSDAGMRALPRYL